MTIARHKWTDEEVKAKAQEIRKYTPYLAGQVLQPAADGKSWLCPYCGHGKGTSKGKDGAKLYRWNRFKCHACGKKFDIIDIYQYLHQVGTGEAMEELGKMINLPEAKKNEPAIQKPKKSPAECIAEHEGQVLEPMPKEWRGISAEIYNQHGARFCRRCKNPKIAGTYNGARPAVSFPLSNGGYFIRAVIDMPIGEGKGKELCNRWEVGENNGVFNAEALKSGADVVFVAESCIDALSFLSVGYQAVGLTGAGKGEALLDLLVQEKPQARLLVALDNDKEGQDRQREIIEAVKTLGIECMGIDTAVLYAGLKDANEALVQDRQGFSERLGAVVTMREEKAVSPYGGAMTATRKALQDGTLKKTPTNVKIIDDLYGGGLSPKTLIMLGGQTGSSKTAFTHWWIETQAQKNPKFTALFFNFEMDRETLMARSVARLMHEAGEDLTLDAVCEGGADALRGLDLWEKQLGGRVEYFYCLESREAIEAKVQQVVKYNRENGLDVPYIVLDYLQILPSTNVDERKAIAENMHWMKTKLANALNTVVVCITSMNRQSRNSETSDALNSALGSSSIEYDADAFMSIRGHDAGNIKTLTLHKARRARPNVSKDITFLGQYAAFTYEGDSQNKGGFIDRKGRKKYKAGSRGDQKEAQDLFDGVGKK